MRIKLGLLSCVALLAACLCSAQAAGPELKTHIVTNGKERATVKIQQHTGAVEVKLDHARKGETPQEVEITLFGQSGEPVTLSLTAMGTERGIYAGVIPATTPASLGGAQQSFVGIELRIPWPSGKKGVLRSGKAAGASR